MPSSSPDAAAARRELLASHVSAFPGHSPVVAESLGGSWHATCPHCTWSAVIEQQGRVPLDPDWTE